MPELKINTRTKEPYDAQFARLNENQKERLIEKYKEQLKVSFYKPDPPVLKKINEELNIDLPKEYSTSSSMVQIEMASAKSLSPNVKENISSRKEVNEIQSKTVMSAFLKQKELEAAEEAKSS